MLTKIGALVGSPIGLTVAGVVLASAGTYHFLAVRGAKQQGKDEGTKAAVVEAQKAANAALAVQRDQVAVEANAAEEQRIRNEAERVAIDKVRLTMRSELRTSLSNIAVNARGRDAEIMAIPGSGLDAAIRRELGELRAGTSVDGSGKTGNTTKTP